MFQETEEIHIREYFYVIRKWKWMILTFCVVFAVFAAFKTYRQIPLYKATARLIIGAGIPKADPFKDDYYWDRFMDAEDRNTQHMLLKSRELAVRVVESLGMLEEAEQTSRLQEEDVKPVFSWRSVWTIIPTLLGAKPQQPTESASAANMRDLVIEGIANRIIVQPVEESHLVDISVISPKPAEAVRIVNTVAEEFVAQDLEVKTAASRDAVSWLIDEVDRARQKVADSELALQQYKEEYAIVALEDRQNLMMQKLTTFNNAVNRAKIRRIEAEAQYRKLKENSAGLEAFTEFVRNSDLHWLKIDLSRLEREVIEAEAMYRDKHPNVVMLRSQIDVLEQRITKETQGILRGFLRDYEVAESQEEKLQEELERQKQEALELDQKSITYSILVNEIDSNRWVYDTLLQKMKEMSINERLENSNIRIVDRANMPNAPINIRTERTIFLALFMGIAAGVSLAFFFEYLDNSIKTPEELKQYVRIPFLGFIPKIVFKALKDAQPEHIVALAPKSIVSEAYRSLRTSVTFSAINKTSQISEVPKASAGTTLLVTSAAPSEGKSCTVANLAIAMAQSGRKTLVVDCDFRKPQVHKIFKVKNEHGFADVLSHFKMRGKIDIKRTNFPNLDVFPCGAIPPNPSELLESPLMKKIIDALATRYDTVLLDSPPINSVTDPIILSRLVNGVVLVIRAGETKRDIVQQATEQLSGAGAHVLGGVINSVDMRKNKYYYYYAYHYAHYYGKKDVAIALK